MKKLSLLTLCVSSIMLFSFCKVDKGIRKINDSLWEVRSMRSMSTSDQALFADLIKKEYGLKDFKTVRILEFKGEAGKWWAVTNKKWCWTVFNEKAVAGEGKDKKALSVSQTEMANLLQKYTSDKTK
jgi:hypothetical protein